MQDLVLALRAIAWATVETAEGQEMRRVALAGLRAAERWGPLPEVP